MYQELSRNISIDNSLFEMSFKYSINTSTLDEDTYLETWTINFSIVPFNSFISLLEWLIKSYFYSISESNGNMVSIIPRIWMRSLAVELGDLRHNHRHLKTNLIEFKKWTKMTSQSFLFRGRPTYLWFYLRPNIFRFFTLSY